MVLLYVNGCVFTAYGSINFFKNLIKFNPFHCIQNNLTQTQDNSGEGEEGNRRTIRASPPNLKRYINKKKLKERLVSHYAYVTEVT